MPSPQVLLQSPAVHSDHERALPALHGVVDAESPSHEPTQPSQLRVRVMTPSPQSVLQAPALQSLQDLSAP